MEEIYDISVFDISVLLHVIGRLPNMIMMIMIKKTITSTTWQVVYTGRVEVDGPVLNYEQTLV